MSSRDEAQHSFHTFEIGKRDTSPDDDNRTVKNLAQASHRTSQASECHQPGRKARPKEGWCPSLPRQGNERTHASRITSGRINYRHHTGRDVFKLLDAAVQCQHEWLCAEAFHEATAMLGRGSADGLPAHPRELRAVLASLHAFLSLSLDVDGGGVRRRDTSGGVTTE